MASTRPAILLTAPHTFEPGEVVEPIVPDDAVAVDVIYTGLCGTDLHIAAGDHPRARFPLAIGHELVGRLASEPETGDLVVVDPLIACGECTACLADQAHVCRYLRLVGIDTPGGLAGRVIIQRDRVHAVPRGVAPEIAIFAEPLAVAVHAVGRAPVTSESIVVVLGAGPIGLLLAHVLRHAGIARLLLSEPVPARRAFAEGLGFELLDPREPVSDLADRTGGALADVAFDAAAVPAVAAMLPSVVRPGGTVALVGVYDRPVPVDLMAFVFREMTLLGNRVYTPGDIDRAIELIAGGDLDVRPLISAIVPASATGDAMARLRSGEGVKFLVDVRWPG